MTIQHAVHLSLSWLRKLRCVTTRALRPRLGLPLRAGLYVRHSSHDRYGTEFAQQLRAVRRYADDLGVAVTRVYADTSNLRTPLSAIRAAAERGEFDILIVEQPHRLTRRLGTLLPFARSVQLHTVDSNDLFASFPGETEFNGDASDATGSVHDPFEYYGSHDVRHAYRRRNPRTAIWSGRMQWTPLGRSPAAMRLRRPSWFITTYGRHFGGETGPEPIGGYPCCRTSGSWKQRKFGATDIYHLRARKMRMARVDSRVFEAICLALRTMLKGNTNARR